MSENKERRPHDPQVCGLSPDTDCDACRARTLAYRQKEIRLSDLQVLEDRLKKANIDVGTLTDLIWLNMHGAFDRAVKAQVHEEVEKLLADCSIVSVIRGVQRNKEDDQAERWD